MHETETRSKLNRPQKSVPPTQPHAVSKLDESEYTIPVSTPWIDRPSSDCGIARRSPIDAEPRAGPYNNCLNFGDGPPEPDPAEAFSEEAR